MVGNLFKRFFMYGAAKERNNFKVALLRL